MSGIINSEDGVPFGTTRDRITISELQSDLDNLRELVKDYLKKQDHANLQKLHEVVYPKRDGKQHGRSWKI